MTRVGKHVALPILGACLAIAGCHPTGVENVNDYSTVSTVHDGTFNFGAARTYSVPTQVVYINGPDAGVSDIVPAQIQQAVIGSIQSNMNARGYTQVQPSANPDLIATAAIAKVTNIGVYYPYWCYYWGWYYPCYGGGYYPPYYPPVVTSYTVGTVIVDLGTAVPSANKYNGVWTAVLRGVAASSTTTNATLIVNGINQAFEQSPYLEAQP